MGGEGKGREGKESVEKGWDGKGLCFSVLFCSVLFDSSFLLKSKCFPFYSLLIVLLF